MNAHRALYKRFRLIILSRKKLLGLSGVMLQQLEFEGSVLRVSGSRHFNFPRSWYFRIKRIESEIHNKTIAKWNEIWANRPLFQLLPRCKISRFGSKIVQPRHRTLLQYDFSGGRTRRAGLLYSHLTSSLFQCSNWQIHLFISLV
jgi:hypothetical protein